MDDRTGYAVYFFPQALEVLGDAIRPFLVTGASGEHLACREVDTAGAFVDIKVDGHDAAGRTVEFELMVPTNMVRMIVSTRADEVFGFVPRGAAAPLGLPVAAVPAKPAATVSASAARTPADDLEG